MSVENLNHKINRLNAVLEQGRKKGWNFCSDVAVITLLNQGNLIGILADVDSNEELHIAPKDQSDHRGFSYSFPAKDLSPRLPSSGSTAQIDAPTLPLRTQPWEMLFDIVRLINQYAEQGVTSFEFSLISSLSREHSSPTN